MARGVGSKARKIPMVGDADGKADTSTPSTAPPPMGHNLTEAEQKEAIYRARVHAVRLSGAKVRAAQEVVRAAQEVVKAERKLLTLARNRFKADTLIPLNLLDRMLEKADLSKGDLQQEAIDWHWMCEMEGIPVGGQMDMVEALEKMPTAAVDEIDAEAEGYRMGLRAEDPVLPPGMATYLHPALMKGWHAGQERNIWALAESGKIVDRDPTKKASPPLPPEPEDDDDVDVDAEAKRLKNSDFMDRDAPDGDDDDS